MDKHIPISTVEHNCILSKKGDITVVFRAEYPECLTRSNEEYEALNQARIKAIQSLPDNTLFVQQDYFKSGLVEERVERKSFLSKASDRFFNGRKYQVHTCYISIVKMPANRHQITSGFNSLIRGTFAPQQTIQKSVLQDWESSVGQFKRLMKEAGIDLRRLTDNELMSSEKTVGIIEQYLFQTKKDKPVIKDISFAGGVHVGNDIC